MVREVEFSVTVEPSQVEKDVIHAVQMLVDEWNDVEPSKLVVTELKGGVTNKLFSCTKGDSDHGVLVRIYGNQTEMLIDRDIELKNIVILHRNGFAPKFYGNFTNGFIYGYFPGRDLSPEDLASGKFNKKIATKMALWHKQEFPGEKTPTLWPKLRKWMSLVPQGYGDEEKDRKFQQEFGSIETLTKEMELLQSELSKVESPVVFAHNDLLGRNIIWDEVTETINFIDYEYGNYNYRAFDIANHFCEWAGFELDYSKYPNKEQQTVFLRAYLEAANNGTEPTEEEIHDLYVEANRFALASHFFWGTWALVQTHISHIQFDFLQYAIDRFKQYYKIKDEYLNLK